MPGRQASLLARDGQCNRKGRACHVAQLIDRHDASLARQPELRDHVVEDAKIRLMRNNEADIRDRQRVPVEHLSARVDDSARRVVEHRRTTHPELVQAVGHISGVDEMRTPRTGRLSA